MQTAESTFRIDLKEQCTASAETQIVRALEKLSDALRRQSELEEAWQEERNLLRAMVDQVPDYLFAKGRDGRFLIANAAVAHINGRSKPDDMIGLSDFELHTPDVAANFFALEQSVIRTGVPMNEMEEMIVDAKGEKRWLSTSKLPLKNDRDEIVGLIGISRDITDRKLSDERIHFLAHHDILTGLPNRALLADRLAQAILNAERDRLVVSVAFVDLDNFKAVNDSRGHDMGDLFLKIVADRIRKGIRQTDTLVRLGGDEFVILFIDRCGAPNTAPVVIESIRSAIAEPVDLDGGVFQVTCSVGLASYPQDGSDAETLLKNADTAMYQAKALGRDNFQIYTTALDSEVRERFDLQEEIRQGLARNEFFLVYQPQIEIHSGKILAVEALARWQHPTRGLIVPDKFIPLAEKSGLIIPLGDWVLREACRQNRQWQDAGLPPIKVCVNVSPLQFRDKSWTDKVKDALGNACLLPQYLELELTESLLMQDVGAAVETMESLQSIGVQFSIDDFGTGYSSLSALKYFPVARLKIDQLFVRNLPEDSDGCSITAALIALGQKLNMRVVAEGVETDEQLTFLRENHCDEIQGFHFSRPLAPEAISDLLVRQ